MKNCEIEGVHAIHIAEKQWTGEGPPPVGAVCELKHRVLLAGAHDSKWFDEGDQVEVGGHAFFTGAEGSVCTVCVVGQNYTGTLIYESLRPIRTPEQIAAEEREREFEEIRMIIGRNSDIRDAAEELLSLGYRKQVKP